jgi:hypothetical protein
MAPRKSAQACPRRREASVPLAAALSLTFDANQRKLAAAGKLGKQKAEMG